MTASSARCRRCQPFDMKASRPLSIVGKMKPTLAGDARSLIVRRRVRQDEIARLKADVEGSRRQAS
jgi:hypothetical protein